MMSFIRTCQPSIQQEIKMAEVTISTKFPEIEFSPEISQVIKSLE
jgi:hypothetical protein